jgi:GT2 family glycosyltransferase
MSTVAKSVKWTMPRVDSEKTLTAVIVAFRNDLGDVARLARTLVDAGEEAGFKTDALIVLNDESVSAELSDFRVIQGHGNVGFARGVRLGVVASTSEFIAIVNPDIEPNLPQFTRMFSGTQPGRSISTPLLTDETGRIQFETYEDWVFAAGRQLSARLCKRFILHTDRTDLGAFTKICGAFIVLERRIACELGGPFDADFFLYGEDRDLSRRARELGIGLKLRRDVRVVHVGGVSGTSAAELVMRAKADSALRIAHRKYGRFGVVAVAADLMVEAILKARRGGWNTYSARLWAVKRWIAQPGVPAPLDSSVLTT